VRSIAQRRFASLRTPTLFLVGGDCPERCEVSPILDPVMPDSRIVVMPGQQHMAFETSPDLFAREVLAFLLDSMTSADAH
jgi:pimeloyl-ACP methyl ester carboxylesterase